MSVITADHPRTNFIDDDQVPLRLPREGDGWRHELGPNLAWSRRTSFGCRPYRDPRHGTSWEARFAEVVDARLPGLQRLARRILRSEDLADDAVQEALLSLWKEGRMPPNPEGWLVNAVVLRSLHLNRSRRRRRDHEERACARRPEHDPGGDASRPLEVAEVVRAIDAALSTLPDHLRSVFVLREAEQLDYGEIAGALQIPVGTVRSRLHRAREALQGALRDQEAYAAR